MEPSPGQDPPHRRQDISPSLLIRMINETIERIRKNMAVPILPSREETLVTTLTTHLEQAGLPPATDEPPAPLEELDPATDLVVDRPSLTESEIKTALDTIPGLSVVEKVIFADDLHWLGRKEQDEFLDLLHHRV